MDTTILSVQQKYDMYNKSMKLTNLSQRDELLNSCLFISAVALSTIVAPPWALVLRGIACIPGIILLHDMDPIASVAIPLGLSLISASTLITSPWSMILCRLGQCSATVGFMGFFFLNPNIEIVLS